MENGREECVRCLSSHEFVVKEENGIKAYPSWW